MDQKRLNNYVLKIHHDYTFLYLLTVLNIYH